MVPFSFFAHADVLFGESYHETMHTYLKEAETSITIAMYFIIINPEDKTNPVNELVNDIGRECRVRPYILTFTFHYKSLTGLLKHNASQCIPRKAATFFWLYPCPG
jgi:hypothetical protein